MKIEFNTPPGEVHDWIIDDLKKKLTEFHQRDKEIYSAQVNFHKRPIAFKGDCVCVIELAVYCNSIMVQRNADSYLQASREVMKELSRIVLQQIHKQKQLPVEILTTVDV
jgi:hypothetical protein